MHGDFVTRAWTNDPLKQALAMIPGYEPTPPPKPAPPAADRAKKKT